MPLIQQTLQLLTEAPYNLVYHLITLLALQVVLGIALGQWGRNRQDEVMRRMVLGAAAMLFTRLILALAIVLLGINNQIAIRYLPPLEQASNTLTLIGLIWAITPTYSRLPRLIDLFAFLLTLITGVLYIVFALDWARRTTLVAYNSDFQATIWSVGQLLLLGVGIVLILIGRGRDWLLRLFILLPLLVAHFIHLWNYPEFLVVDTEVPYLIRLGQLIAFPLLTVVAYRHVLLELAQPVIVTRPQPTPHLTELLQLVTQVIETPDQQRTRSEAVAMVAHLLQPAFVGLAMPLPDNPEQLHLTLLRPRLEQDQYQATFLNLTDWPSFSLALRQGQTSELVPQGMGHQQIHRLAQQAGLDESGPLLIEPLIAQNRPLGLLLLAGKPTLSQWSASDRQLSRGLAYYIAHALLRIRTDTSAAPLTLTQNERETLTQERDEALTQMHQWQATAEATQSRLVEGEQKQVQTGELEKQIASLREALTEAEEALALAATGNTNLSPDWVLRTVSRYSGELEKAQAHIELLEKALNHKIEDRNNDILIGLIQELRTPMTSISGYTDLLLSETMGILGSTQRDFLQRIRANSERANTMLDQLIRAARDGEPVSGNTTADILAIIETAIDAIAPQLREKRLRLDLQLHDLLGQWEFNRDALYQVMVHLLSNACQASPTEGVLSVSGRPETVKEYQEGVASESFLLHLVISDMGEGIAPEDLAQVFEPHVDTDAPLIAGVGDTGIGLAVARQIITANGGRIWVEGQPGTGSIFSVLLPLAPPTVETPHLSPNGSGKKVTTKALEG